MRAKPANSAYPSLEARYQALAQEGAARTEAEQLLRRRHWLHQVGEFDERTGEMLPSPLGQVCAQLDKARVHAAAAGELKDRLYRVVEHVEVPLEEIFRQLHEGLVREHAMLPLRTVRELDTTSFFALSRRPGRTLREKLAERPYLWAVQRRWTVDTAENRLVKSFCMRLAALLRTRAVGWQHEHGGLLHELQVRIESWLYSPAAREIGAWGNLPPNNLLLQHRDYRRVWDAWSWLQTIDEDVQRDAEHRIAQWTTILFWSLVSRLAGHAGVRLLEQPCRLDYEAFAIIPYCTGQTARARVEGLADAPPVGTGLGSLVVEQAADYRLTLCSPDGARVEVRCEDAESQVRVHIDQQLVVVAMNQDGADEVAAHALAGRLGVGDEAGAPIPRAEEPLHLRAGALCVVDLCALRPRFATEDQHGTLRFRLLWQRWQPQDLDPVELDLGSAQAIALGPAVTTISILDLLAVNPVHPPAVLSQAARAFAEKLKQTFAGAPLTYLVPDSTDEFTLDPLRRSVNGAFHSAEPLPRSIAAVFAWQASPQFRASQLSDGDCVLVFDSVGGTLSATPLLARWKAALEQRVPECAGLYWERCPSIQSDGHATSAGAAVRVLKELGCSAPEDLARLCGLQGLLDEGCSVSWLRDGVWYTAPAGYERAIASAQISLESAWSELAHGIDKALVRLTRVARVARVFGLFADDLFPSAQGERPLPQSGRRVVLLGRAPALHCGGRLLHRWQQRAGDLPMWRDHLPELSMRIVENGQPRRFYLVKDVTVAPRRGQLVSIPIDELFVLPSGLPEYQFPLLQGAEENELRYEAVLKSPAFPLPKDLCVRLQLTYAYGSDTPYDLVFVPDVPTSTMMSSVRAEWRPRLESTELPSHFPTLPAPDTWAKFRQYPKRDSAEKSDLIDWVSNQLEWLAKQSKTFAAKRYEGMVTSDWKSDKNGKGYIFVVCAGQSVFCHEMDFVEPADRKNIRRGSTLSLELESSNDRWSGRSIARPERISGAQVLEQKLVTLVDKMKKRIRFPLLTVWAGGRSLDEVDVPATFRKAVQASLPPLWELQHKLRHIGSGVVREELARQASDGVLFLLCAMHKDALESVADRLKDALRGDELRAYWLHIALALGACTLPWQQELLTGVFNRLRQEPERSDVCSLILRLLGRALWQCGAVLDRLPHAELLVIAERLSAAMQDDLASISEHPPDTTPEFLKDHLECLLGLLRTRASEDADVRGLMTPGKPIAKALAKTVERIVDVVSEHNIPIESRIALDVDKPQALDKTPDLLYALKLYLTGDSGARAIHVLRIRADED